MFLRFGIVKIYRRERKELLNTEKKDSMYLQHVFQVVLSIGWRSSRLHVRPVADCKTRKFDPRASFISSADAAIVY